LLKSRFLQLGFQEIPKQADPCGDISPCKTQRMHFDAGQMPIEQQRDKRSGAAYRLDITAAPSELALILEI
jgi:hypothetical protein